MSENKRIIRSLMLISLTLLIFGHAAHQTGLAQENDFIVEEGITYGIGDDIELKLDLARPTTGKGPFPALIFLFGGGYKMGSRTQFHLGMWQAAERGYVAVTIDYRLTNVIENGKPKYIFPSQVHDVKCAVRWLRTNARKYKIDKNHIGVVGFSSGANLALMLGLTDSSDGLEGECGKMKYSSRVQAVVNLAGGTDMVMHYQLYPHVYGPFLGGNPDEVPNRYKAASPLTYVSSDDPPVLSICGTIDRVLQQEELLDDKMKAVGASHTLIVRENAGHSVSALVDFLKDNPVWDFFDKHLKGD